MIFGFKIIFWIVIWSSLTLVLFISCVGGEATHEVRDGKCDSPATTIGDVCDGDEGSEVKRDVTKTNRELEFGCGDGCIKMKGVSIYEND